MTIQWSFEYEKIGRLKRFKHNSLFYDPHSFCFNRQRSVTPTDAHATTGNFFGAPGPRFASPWRARHGAVRRSVFRRPAGFLLIERSIKNR
ncbi:MAG: hypothetical protein V4801_21415 [Burkholderia gladioli]